MQSVYSFEHAKKNLWTHFSPNHVFTRAVDRFFKTTEPMLTKFLPRIFHIYNYRRDYNEVKIFIFTTFFAWD